MFSPVLDFKIGVGIAIARNPLHGPGHALVSRFLSRASSSRAFALSLLGDGSFVEVEGRSCTCEECGSAPTLRVYGEGSRL